MWSVRHDIFLILIASSEKRRQVLLGKVVSTSQNVFLWEPDTGFISCSKWILGQPTEAWELGGNVQINLEKASIGLSCCTLCRGVGLEKMEGMDGIFYFHSLFLVLEYSTPFGIFNSNRGLHHGDSVSPLPFISQYLMQMGIDYDAILFILLNDMISRFVHLLFYFSFSTSFV